MAQYRLTSKADNDLAELYEYGIATFGLARAQEYLIGLHDRFVILSQTPTLGRSAEELAIGLKRFEYGSHVIFFIPNNDGVLIVRVLRQEMDFERYL